jgi:signal peptidase I
MTIELSPPHDRPPATPGQCRRPHRAKRLATAAAVTLTWLLVLGAVALLGLVAIGPHVFGYHIESVLSGSMVPTFSPGDAVLVTSEPTDHLRVGQIISYHIPIGDHHVETHRIVRIVSRGPRPVVVTKGDANSAPDPWHAKLLTARVWHVRAVIPHLGTAIYDLRTPTVHSLTTILAPTLIVVLLLARIWRPTSARSREQE